jgi:pyrroloquinoline quinone (PQQ) biosynthesis protein C
MGEMTQSKRTAREFADDMEAIRARYSVVTTRFAQDLREGKAPLAAVKGLAVQTYYMTVRTGAPCIGKPYGFRDAGSELLRTAIANAVGEIGYMGDPPHAFLARNMCYGLGMTDQEIEDTPITPEMYGYIEMMSLNNRTSVPRLRGAIEITEADSAYSSQLVADAGRKHYGLNDDGVRYWLVHGYADLEHGEENARIAHALCATRQDEDQLLATATRAIKTRRLVWDSFTSFYD